MNNGRFSVPRISIALAACLSLCLFEAAAAQSNGPCQIVYLVRDEKGELIDPALLEAVEAPKGEEMKPGTTFLQTPAGAVVHGAKCLVSKLDIGGRPVKLSVLTLKYRGQTMRLEFNLQIVEEKRIVDSLAFQEGGVQAGGREVE